MGTNRKCIPHFSSSQKKKERKKHFKWFSACGDAINSHTCPIASLSQYSLSIPSECTARGFLILWNAVLLLKTSKHLEQLAPIPSTVNEKKSSAPLTGCTMKPKKARPSPWANPRIPFCRALSTGFLTTPETPKATPWARASVPWMNPSPTPVILLDLTCCHVLSHFGLQELKNWLW